jgi:predicted kinase
MTRPRTASITSRATTNVASGTRKLDSSGNVMALSMGVGRVQRMTRMVLINGAPGSGKSTVAAALAHDRALTLALDVDAIKHALGRWHDDLLASGLHARRLALALAREHLRAGYDVVLGQYLARTDFIEDLEHLAVELGATFVELVLDLDPPSLAERLAGRSSAPTRPEQVLNDRLVGPDDADRLVASLEPLRDSRPRAVWLDGRGSLPSTLDLVRAALS